MPSPPPPPSPVAIHSIPSGPNWSWPPLWLENVGCGMPRTLRCDPGLATVAEPRLRLNSSMRRSPCVVDVVDVEAPRLSVVGVEGDREEPVLGLEGDLLGDVEEGLGEGLAVAQHADRPGQLDDEQQLALAGRARDVGRRVELADLAQRHAAIAVSGRAAGVRRSRAGDRHGRGEQDDGDDGGREAAAGDRVSGREHRRHGGYRFNTGATFVAAVAYPAGSSR